MPALLLAISLLACPTATWAQDATSAPGGNIAASAPVQKSETVQITLKGAGFFGGDIDMVTQVFKPESEPPFPVVVFSHGRAPDTFSRANLVRPVSTAQVHYWLSKGFAIVAPIRPGYGKTGGSDREASGAFWDSGGTCTRRPSFGPTAETGKKAVRATVEWLHAQSWADSKKIILVGQSVGGLVTVAAGSDRLEGVMGYVNFAGGSGGNPDFSPGHSCGAGQLTALYAEAGKSTTLPNVWIYALNDQFWGPDVPSEWHAAFAAGGSPTRFVHAPAVADGNGHGLSSHAQALWSPYLDSFLQSLGLSSGPSEQPTRITSP
jgi:dienelactone hydrolase